jgi:hypothetical protein
MGGMTEDNGDRTSASLSTSLDNAWRALDDRLDGLGDAEYRWEPVGGCWTVREVDGVWQADWVDPDPVPAPVTTIAWRMWHLAVDCFDSYSGRLFGTTGTGLVGPAWVGDVVAARDALGRSWEVFRQGVAGWDGVELHRSLGPGWGTNADRSHLDLALHAGRELIHHGAEIALLRDLHRGATGGRLRTS